MPLCSPLADSFGLAADFVVWCTKTGVAPAHVQARANSRKAAPIAYKLLACDASEPRHKYKGSMNTTSMLSFSIVFVRRPRSDSLEHFGSSKNQEARHRLPSSTSFASQ